MPFILLHSVPEHRIFSFGKKSISELRFISNAMPAHDDTDRVFQVGARA